MSSRFDINKPLDFARMTSQNIQGLANLFAAFSRDQTEWNIVETSFTPAKGSGVEDPRPILLHVFVSKSDYQAGMPSVQDSGGRRHQKIEFIYTDGQTTEDLGRMGETFDLEIVLHGYAYRNGLNKIMNAFQKPTPGTLLHPVRGEVQVKLDTYSIMHSHDRTIACILKLRLIEHNFSLLSFGQTITTVTTKLAKALALLNAILAMLSALASVVTAVRSLVRQIIAKVQEYKAFFQGFLVDSNATFNRGSSSSLPGIVPVNAGGLAAPVTTRGSTVPPSVRGDTTVTAGVGGTATLAGGFVSVGSKFRTIVPANDPLSAVPKDLLSDTARQALSVTGLTKRCTTLRLQAQEIIDDINDAGLALELAEHVLTIKQTVVAAQEVLEQGIQSSSTRIIDYSTPRLMTIREVAFANGIDVNNALDIEIMNPWLESVNYIPKGTTLKVPIS